MRTEAPEDDSEVLTIEPQTLGRRGRHRLLALVATLALFVGGLYVWQHRPRPSEPFSLADLQRAYAGLAGTAGGIDAAVLQREQFVGPVADIYPRECAPLLAPTTASLFPADALDGVGNYWPDEQLATTLFTFRFTDAAAASRQFERLAATVTVCAGRPIEMVSLQRSDPPAGAHRVQSGRLTELPMRVHATQRTAFVLTTTTGVKFAAHVVGYDNLICWQLRYDPRPGDYDPVAAEQLSADLLVQLRSVDRGWR